MQHAHQESAPKNKVINLQKHLHSWSIMVDTVLTRAVNRVLYIPVLLLCVILALIGAVSDAKLVEGSLKTKRKVIEIEPV